MTFDEEIGICVSGWRKQAGLSQDALAQIIGTQQAAVSKIETGKQSLTVEQMVLILRACDIDAFIAAEQIIKLGHIGGKPLWERIHE